MTLTLATAVVSTDTDVKVSYAKPDSGTDNTLVDANGNEVATFTDQAVTNNTAAVVVAPTITGLAVTSTPDAGDTYDTDETIEISVTFSAAVDVRGTPSLTFSMGNSGETVSTDAAYASGTGTTVLVFAYTVQFGDVDNNGIFISNDSDFTGRGAIALGSNGVIVAKDTETAANLALTVGRGSKPNHKVDGATNTGAATVTSVSLTSTPPYFTGDVIEVSVVFSEAVTVDTTDGTPSHQIGIDPRGARDAPYVSGSGTTTLVFRYTVETEDQDDDGVFLRDGATDGALELNMGSITADDVAAVVDAYGGRARHDDHTVNVEPTITAIAVTSDPANGTAYDTNEKIEISVTFSAAVDVTGTGTPSLAFNLGNSGSSVRTAAPYDRGSGTDTLVFAYTVQVGDEDDNGIFLYNDTNSDLGGDGVISLSTSMIVAKDTTTAANIAFASGGGLQASHKVDGTSAATVTSFLLTSTPPVETGYVTGDTIEISVVFSEAVTVDTTDGTPSHQIGIDPRGARDAPYVSGSGTTTLVFRYTVETEDQDDDGVFLRDGATDGALELNMGSITADDVAAVVDAYGGRGRQDAHKVNTQPRITALRVVSTPVLEDDTYGVDEEIRFEVEFDQVVVVSGLPRFELGIPPPEDREFADYDGGSGTATLLFVYVVQTTDVDSDGVYTGFSPAVELTGGSTIQGLGERDAVLTHSITPENHAGHKVDGSPMTVNTAPVAANDSVATGAGEAVTIDVLSNDRDAEDDALTVAAVTTPTSGSAAPNADNTRVVYTPSSGFTGTVRFTYTVSDGAATHSLDSLTVSTATVIVTVGAVSVGTGICGRTPAVRDEILRVLTLAVSPGYTGTCAGVTADWLARATYLEFQTDDGRVTSLRRGDFAGLTGVRRLSFFRQPLASLPAGVFDGLTSLRSLNLEGGQLASLSPGVFDPLRGLTELVLSDNRLSSLGSGVFDGLTSLEWLDLRNNEMRSPFPLAELEKLPALTRLLTQNNPGTRYRVEALPPSVTVEQGGTTSYRVRLMRPGVWVVGTTSQGSTVRPTPPSESAGVSVTPERLTFVPANWFRSREVTVVAAGDATLGPVRIAHRASGKFSTDAPEVRVQVVPATARATATAEDAPATIAGAPVVSDPGADGAWTPGEAVEVGRPAVPVARQRDGHRLARVRLDGDLPQAVAPVDPPRPRHRAGGHRERRVPQGRVAEAHVLAEPHLERERRAVVRLGHAVERRRDPRARNGDAQRLRRPVRPAREVLDDACRHRHRDRGRPVRRRDQHVVPRLAGRAHEPGGGAAFDAEIGYRKACHGFRERHPHAERPGHRHLGATGHRHRRNAQICFDGQRVGGRVSDRPGVCRVRRHRHRHRAGRRRCDLRRPGARIDRGDAVLDDGAVLSRDVCRLESGHVFAERDPDVERPVHRPFPGARHGGRRRGLCGRCGRRLEPDPDGGAHRPAHAGGPLGRRPDEAVAPCAVVTAPVVHGECDAVDDELPARERREVDLFGEVDVELVVAFGRVVVHAFQLVGGAVDHEVTVGDAAVAPVRIASILDVLGVVFHLLLDAPLPAIAPLPFPVALAHEVADRERGLPRDVGVRRLPWCGPRHREGRGLERDPQCLFCARERPGAGVELRALVPVACDGPARRAVAPGEDDVVRVRRSAEGGVDEVRRVRVELRPGGRVEQGAAARVESPQHRPRPAGPVRRPHLHDRRDGGGEVEPHAGERVAVRVRARGEALRVVRAGGVRHRHVAEAHRVVADGVLDGPRAAARRDRVAHRHRVARRHRGRQRQGHGAAAYRTGSGLASATAVPPTVTVNADPGGTDAGSSASSKVTVSVVPSTVAAAGGTSEGGVVSPMTACNIAVVLASTVAGPSADTGTT